MGQFSNDREDLADQLRVERARDFVEEHDLRPHRKGLGNGNALLLPTRQLGGIGVELAAQPNLFQKLAGGRRRAMSAAIVPLGGEPRRHCPMRTCAERG